MLYLLFVISIKKQNISLLNLLVAKFSSKRQKKIALWLCWFLLSIKVPLFGDSKSTSHFIIPPPTCTFVCYIFCTSILCIFISNSADVFVVGEVNAVRPQQRAPRDGVSSFISSHNIEIDLSTDAFLCEIHLCCAWERRIAITICTFIHSLSAAAFCKQRDRNSSEPVSLPWLGERWFFCACVHCKCEGKSYLITYYIYASTSEREKPI